MNKVITGYDANIQTGVIAIAISLLWNLLYIGNVIAWGRVAGSVAIMLFFVGIVFLIVGMFQSENK